MKTYRIAFVNPYVTAAEVQAFESLRRVAEAEGIVIEHKRPKDLREDDPFDFLIPVAFTPKTTSHPSLLSCHSPRAVYVDDEATFGAIASHDGYLSISENLKSFFSSLCSAWDKPLTSVGDYYNCPQLTDISTDVEGLAASGRLSLCYFGINWDMRAEPLFRALSQKPWMRIYGPPDSWRTVRPEAYKGQLPFDGASVQKEYARFGAGLVCLGYEHLMDDIISNRVFEISSVGAASISPDTPWMRKHFGDSVLYYDPFTSIEAIVDQIDAGFRDIRANPAAAAARAAHARAIFEDRFHARVMLKGAVEHFDRWKAASTLPAALAEAKVDVILRGRGDAAATLGSLRRQRAGRVRVLRVGGEGSGDAALSVERFADLAGALAAVTAPAFAIINAGERLLSHHMERLLPPLLSGGAALTYADALAPAPTDAADLVISFQGPAGGPLGNVLRLPLACVLLHRSIAGALLSWRNLPSADEQAIVARLLAAGRAEHRPGPTCILPSAPPPPADDLESRLAHALETAPLLAALRANAPEQRASLLAPIAEAVTDIGEAKLDAIAANRVFEGGMIGRDVRDRDDVVFVDVPLSPVRLAGVVAWERVAEDGVRFHPRNAFDIALRVDMADYILDGCRPSVVFSLDSADDTLFLGLVDSAGEIVARTITPKSRKPLRVWVNSTTGAPPSEAIIQAWKRPPAAPVVLSAVTIAYRVSEVAVALQRADLTREEAHALMEARARSETVGDAVAGNSAAVDLRHARSAFRHRREDASDGALRLGSGRVAWDYFAQVFVPAAPGARALRLDLGATAEPVYAFLTDTAFAKTLTPLLPLRGGKAAATVWLPLPAEPQDLYLVLQAQDSPSDAEVVIERLSVV